MHSCSQSRIPHANNRLKPAIAPLCAQLIKQAERRQQEQPAAGQGGGAAGELPVEVKAQLAVLAQQWPVAESLLLAQGRVDDTIAAYRDAHR
jgi:hypothetical protein